MVNDLALPGFAFVRVFDEVTSTMDVARDAVASIEKSPGVVCARSQSQGRGRQGRGWSSASGALMMTALFPTALPLSSLSGYSLVVGLALADAFEEFGARLQLKWPNDLVVVSGDTLRKVGGILIEVQDCGGSRVILVGVGVNLTQAPDDVVHASSIEALCSRALSIEEALISSCAKLRVAHELFVSCGGFSRFRERWEESSCFVKGNTTVSLDLGEREASGRYVGVDERGAILLSEGDRVTAYHSGHLISYSGLKRSPS